MRREDKETGARLRRCIEEAFADVPYPGDDRIASNPRCCSECWETDEFFKGRHWRDLARPGVRLPFLWAGLALLTPEAFHFFLPGYLLSGMNTGERYGDSADAALLALTPDDLPSLRGYREERYALFSPAQEACIAEYATWYGESDPEYNAYAETAAYWWARVAARTGGE
jgi:hypothetical protein